MVDLFCLRPKGLAYNQSNEEKEEDFQMYVENRI